MEQDGEKRPEACKAHQDRAGSGGGVISLQFVVHVDRRPQGDACEQRVNGHSEERPHPTHAVLSMRTAFMAVLGGVVGLVMMEAEEAFQEEDQEEAGQERHRHP